MRPHAVLKVALVTCLVVASIMLAGPSAFGQGRPPGAGGGGGGGGHTESAVNNLSYPAVTTSEASALAAEPFRCDAPSLASGETYSYGCDKPEVVGTTTYPNTRASSPRRRVQYLTAASLHWRRVRARLRRRPDLLAEDPDELLEGPRSTAVTPEVVDIPRLGRQPREQELDGHVHHPRGNGALSEYLTTDPTPTKRGYQMWHVSGPGPGRAVGGAHQATPILQSPWCLRFAVLDHPHGETPG